jgi:hypothetical protein
LCLRHACHVPWFRSSGGIEAEREERQKYKDEQAERDRRNHEFIANLRREGFRKVGRHAEEGGAWSWGKRREASCCEMVGSWWALCKLLDFADHTHPSV